VLIDRTGNIDLIFDFFGSTGSGPPPLNNYFFVARRLVAAALSARDPAAVVPFDRGRHHAAALSWADGDTTWADADGGVGVVPPATVSIVAVPPDLNIDALGHLDALGFGRSDERGSCQHRCGCRHGKSDLHHVGPPWA